MELVKIGRIIKNWTGNPPYKTKFIMVDIRNPYYNMLLINNEFINKYNIMKSQDIVKVEVSEVFEDIEIDNTITTSSLIGTIKMNKSEKIIDVIDNIILTNSYLYVRIDKGYFREKTFEKLGL